MNTRAQLLPLKVLRDERGALIIGQGEALPFIPVRFFATTDVPTHTVRGHHAHKSCQQVIIALKGSCRLVLVDTLGRDELLLDSPLQALFIPPMIWLEQFDFALDAVILVLASDLFDERDYIRSYADFLEALAG